MLDNLNTALEKELKPLDILYANEQMVLYSALLGEAPPLNYRLSKYRHKSLKERMILNKLSGYCFYCISRIFHTGFFSYETCEKRTFVYPTHFTPKYIASF